MWTTFKSIVSYLLMAPFYFDLEIPALLRQPPKVPGMKCRTTDANILNATLLSSRLQKWSRPSILEDVRVKSSALPFDEDDSQVTYGRASCMQLCHWNQYLGRRRQAIDNATAASDLQSKSPAITVSISSYLSSASPSSTARISVASLGSSIVVQTTASTDVTDAVHRSSVQPATPPPSWPSTSTIVIESSRGNAHSAGTTSQSPTTKTSGTVDFTSSQDQTPSSTTETSASSITPSGRGTIISSSFAVQTSVLSTKQTSPGNTFTSSSGSVSQTLATTDTPMTSGTSSSMPGSSQAVLPNPISSSTTACSSLTACTSPMETFVTSSTSTSTSATTEITTAPATTATYRTLSSSAANSSTSEDIPSTSSSTKESTSTMSSRRTLASFTTPFPSSSPSTIFVFSSTPAITASYSSSISQYINSTPTSLTVILPLTTTVIVFTTAPLHSSTTSIGTGALRTSISTASGFSQNTGAIVGVSIAAFVTFLSILFLIFFACRRYRRRPRQNAYVDGLRRLARDISYRSPVDGDEEHFADKPPSHQQRVSSQGHSLDGLNDETLLGDQRSHGHGSAESAAATMVPIGTVFGGQPYMPSLEPAQGLQSVGGALVVSSEVELRLRSHTPIPMDAWCVPTGMYTYPDHNGRTRSAASLFLPPTSSTGHTTSSSSAEEGLLKKGRTSSGRTHDSLKTTGQHHSTPPSAFIGWSTSPFEQEYQRQSKEYDQEDMSSVKKLFNRVRNGRPKSTQSSSSARGARALDVETPVHPTLSVFSPSLLNPPVVVLPPRPALTFPRSVTGHGYTDVGPESKFGMDSGVGAAVPWPPATLPEMTPSPAPTDNSSVGMIEHLLHPRLALSRARSEQASVASLRDNEDYSRPINGLVNNHLRSTTTFETHDTAESDQAG